MVRWVQAATGMLFAAFVAAHLLNTWLASVGPGAHAAAQRALSTVYQAPLVEWLICAALLLRAACAVLSWRMERRGPLPEFFYPYYALLGFGGALFEIGAPWQSKFARLYLRLLDG